MPKQEREFTYETGIDEPIHPTPSVAAEMEEVRLSSCEFGCKIYKHPSVDIYVLAHNSSYGCKRTRGDILADAVEGTKPRID